MVDEKRDDAIIPSFHIIAESIPEAFWETLNVVHHHGRLLRTQYDRKNSNGNYIDPPGRDASVLIEVKNPFAQPRHPGIVTCEIGKVIAEYLGAKDHLVPSYDRLYNLVKKARAEGRKVGEEETLWPYTYFLRLTRHPTHDGGTINQLENAVNILAQDPLSRRAVAVTAVPEIDQYLEADQPCLREVQFRAIEYTQPGDEKRKFKLGMGLRFRSNDLPKAWPDNVISLTQLQARLAKDLALKTGWEVSPGYLHHYAESLHIYGEDYVTTGGKFNGDPFFQKFPNAASFVKKSRAYNEQVTGLVIDQLNQLKTESTWRFPPESIALIEQLVDDFETGRFVP